MDNSRSDLHCLADLYGIKTIYLDMNGSPVIASEESLLAVLNALGAEVSRIDDIPAAVRAKRQQYWQRIIEPVAVVWNDETPHIDVRFPASVMGSVVKASIKLETGEEKTFEWRPDESSVIDSTLNEGTQYVSLRLNLSEHLPLGYHKITIDSSERTKESLVISAPVKACQPEEGTKIWGVFLPLYALHTSRSWGAGDLSDLEAFLEWISGLGGQLAGTLPLLPSFFDDETGPGPYMPASRLFWNEFYLDINRIPELEGCPPAKSLMNSAGYQKAIEKLRSSSMVDYKYQLFLKRKILEEMTDYFFNDKPGRFAQFKNTLEQNPQMEDYAAFRAAGDINGINWHQWPDRMSGGNLQRGDYPEKHKQYHLYTQWLAREQISSVFKKASQYHIQVYSDLPVGVHPYSYDVWRERDTFVPEINGGAPPDPVFTSGQNWHFPPLHPDKTREQGYRYVIQILRHQLEHSGMLRLDHMMNFHRLFWIPEGMENREGVYVSYPAEELYAILTLESYRHRSIIIGEDLGIVPPEVRPMMEKHGIYRMYVGQYELITENRIGKVPEKAVASLNTHDMFPFASFWQEQDINQRKALGIVKATGAQKEIEQRLRIKNALIGYMREKGLNICASQDIRVMLKAILDFLAISPTFALLVNLEDLWLETEPQNIPGTQSNRNWSHKARYSLEEFSILPEVVDILKEIDRERRSTQ
jgi:4-alpha-glucanotransferase